MCERGERGGSIEGSDYTSGRWLPWCCDSASACDGWQRVSRPARYPIMSACDPLDNGTHRVISRATRRYNIPSSALVGDPTRRGTESVSRGCNRLQQVATGCNRLQQHCAVWLMHTAPTYCTRHRVLACSRPPHSPHPAAPPPPIHTTDQLEDTRTHTTSYGQASE